MPYLWGVDLGGTKTEIAVMEAASLRILERHRAATPVSKGYDALLDNMASMIRQTADAAGLPLPDVVGVAAPGMKDFRTGLHKNSNTTALNGRPFHDDLMRVLGRKVILENDANCFALAETRLGVIPEFCPEARVVFGVILGTGVGGGLVVNGRLVRGAHGIAGEWGHNPLEEDGTLCYCGRNGCVETVISGPALEQRYLAQSGHALKLVDIAGRTSTDEHARDIIDHLIESMGRALAVVVNILDPDAIVLGGGVGNIEALYTRGPLAIARYVFNNRFDTPLLRPRLGDSAGVLGAALLTEPGR